MKRLMRETYLQTIRNSCGSLLFRNVYVENDDGKTTDILENGNLSCAIFVTSILCMFGKIDSRHATVGGTVKALSQAGWSEVQLDQLEEGDIIVWENITNPNGELHGHIGFYLGKELAISNSSENGFPIIHHWQYNGSRKIIQAFRHAWPAEPISSASSTSQAPHST